MSREQKKEERKADREGMRERESKGGREGEREKLDCKKIYSVVTFCVARITLRDVRIC